MDLRPGSARERMEAACKGMLEATQDLAAWEWDDRYFAALAVIESPHESDVLASLSELLPHSWNHVDIKSAPEPVLQVSGVWGGLMVDQLMFALDPGDDPMLFASWWPWGSRLKFSLRVSCSARGEAVVKSDPQAKLRSYFGL